jgi:hypothetical protein
MATLRSTFRAQGGYYVVTGAAPFVSRRAFERVTGPKAEWWLVQTTGGLITAVGAGMLQAARRPDPPPEVRTIAIGCAATLAAIDMVYAAEGRISRVYLVDAVVEAAFVASLIRRGRPRMRGAAPGATARRRSARR